MWREGQAARDTLGTAPVVTEASAWVFSNIVVCSFRFSFMFQHPPSPHSIQYLRGVFATQHGGSVGTEHLKISHIETCFRKSQRREM